MWLSLSSKNKERFPLEFLIEFLTDVGDCLGYLTEYALNDEDFPSAGGSLNIGDGDVGN